MSDLSKIIITSVFGHSGRGLLFFKIKPQYLKLIKTAKKFNTTIIAKSITLHKTKGNFKLYNPWKSVRKYSDRTLINAYGLSNEGFKVHIPEIIISQKRGYKVIASLVGTIMELIQILNHLNDNHIILDQVELNISCPNSTNSFNDFDQKSIDIFLIHLGNLKKIQPNLYVIIKIGHGFPFEIIQEFEKIGIDALHAINAIPFNTIFPERKSPLEKLGGGAISGRETFHLAHVYNTELRKKTNLRIIMGCGVSSMETMRAYFTIGADHVSFCSLAVFDIEEAIKMIEVYN